MELTVADVAAIRRNAYFRWLDAGAPPGDGIDFWLEAESDYLHNPPEEDFEPAGEEERGSAPDWVAPANRENAEPDKELLIGTRG
jgi:hypothetical protein